MWRKIHSNRDPRDTLYSELRKEFRPWFEKLINGSRQLMAVYPRLVFSVMIILLLGSGILSFTVFRHPDTKRPPKAPPPQPAVVSDGFGQIMQAAASIKESIRLKRMVDSLTSKDWLSAADSVLLDSALSRLQHIQPINKNIP